MLKNIRYNVLVFVAIQYSCCILVLAVLRYFYNCPTFLMGLGTFLTLDNREFKQATFLTQGRQLEVNRALIDDEWWRQSFLFQTMFHVRDFKRERLTPSLAIFDKRRF